MQDNEGSRHASRRPSKLALTIALLAAASLPLSADAAFGLETVRQIAEQQGITPAQGAASTAAVRNLIIQLVKFLLYIISAVALLAIAYGGFLYVTSAGEESRARQGKTAVLYAAIGLLLASLSAALVNLFT